MKKKLLSVTFILGSIIAFGQSYKISPSKTVNVLAPYNDTSKFEIYFENISKNTITLNWKLISNKLVAGWECFICDNVSCCHNVPQKGNMPYIDPGIEVYLALNVNPKTIAGTGILQLVIYEGTDSLNADTLTWIVNSSPTVINEFVLNSNMKIFPNPVTDNTVIDLVGFPLGHKSTLTIYNSIGQKMLETTLNTNFEKLDLGALPNGAYLIEIQDERKNRITKKIIK